MSRTPLASLSYAGFDAESNSASPRPLYQTVKDHVVDLIESNGLAPGARVPSEQELVQALGASRMTVNRALRELTAEGILTRVAGVGTFVAKRRNESELLAVRNIADEVRSRGARYSCRIHKLTKMRATRLIAQSLDLDLGGAVFRSVIVHFENDAPVQLEDRYVNPAVAPDYLAIDFTKRTPNDFLCEVAPISAVEHIVEAILPDSLAQKLLAVSAREPCLRLYRSTRSFGRKATCVWLTHPGKLYRMVAHFTPRMRRVQTVDWTRSI